MEHFLFKFQDKTVNGGVEDKVLMEESLLKSIRGNGRHK